MDVPLRLILDEAANTCPVPLEAWSSDFGSHGITLCPAFQSRQQVIGRWGIAGAGAITNNTGATVLHAYGSETTDLQHFVTLSGTRIDERGHRVPVLSLTQLTTLARGTTVVWPPETPVTIGRMRPAWRRRDLRRQLKAEKREAAAVVAETEKHLADAAAGASNPERAAANTASTAPTRRWTGDPGRSTQHTGAPVGPGDRAVLNGRSGGAGDDAR